MPSALRTMNNLNDDLPTKKNNPLTLIDWLLIGTTVIILLVSFPMLWRVYRFFLPLAAIGFAIYFIVKFIQLGKVDLSLPEGTSRNFALVWAELKYKVRTSFRAIAITVIVMVVLSVTAILLFGKYTKGEVTQDRMDRMTQALEKHKSAMGAYPSGLAELIGNDPLKREWFKDSWGNEIRYTINKDGLGYKLSSPGADGKWDNEDDIVRRK